MMSVVMKASKLNELKPEENKDVHKLNLTWTSPLPSSLTSSVANIKVNINTKEFLGVVSTLAGKGSGFFDGGKDEAKFSGPWGVAVDKSDNVYLADSSNHRIRKITSQGVVSTFAGSGVAGCADGVGTYATFNCPSGIAFDGDDDLYIVENHSHRVRKITKHGIVCTIAGSLRGFEDGSGSTSKFYSPSGIVLDTNKNIFIADPSNHRIRKITPQGVVSTIAGNGIAGYVDGNSSSARFSSPQAITLDREGNLYVADYSNQRIRKITPSGIVSTVAGSSRGYQDGVGSQAQFNGPIAIAIDDAGNLLVADYHNHRIRKVTPQGVVSTVAGSGNAGHVDGECSKALFNYPHGVTFDSYGNVILADWSNHSVRKIS